MACHDHDWTRFRCPNCNVAKPIRDRDTVRFDWEGLPRFYFVRVWPSPRLRAEMYDGSGPRVLVLVHLEGDELANTWERCEDNEDAIREAFLECVKEIESVCAGVWEEERDGEADDSRLSEQRFYY